VPRDFLDREGARGLLADEAHGLVNGARVAGAHRAAHARRGVGTKEAKGDLFERERCHDAPFEGSSTAWKSRVTAPFSASSKSVTKAGAGVAASSTAISGRARSVLTTSSIGIRTVAARKG
jgi:hypothetical protein